LRMVQSMSFAARYSSLTLELMGNPLPSQAAPDKLAFERSRDLPIGARWFDRTSVLCNHKCGTDYALRLAKGFRFENLVLKPIIPDRSRLKFNQPSFKGLGHSQRPRPPGFFLWRLTDGVCHPHVLGENLYLHLGNTPQWAWMYSGNGARHSEECRHCLFPFPNWF
jgi:hypothetical protein